MYPSLIAFMGCGLDLLKQINFFHTFLSFFFFLSSHPSSSSFFFRLYKKNSNSRNKNVKGMNNNWKEHETFRVFYFCFSRLSGMMLIKARKNKKKKQTNAEPKIIVPIISAAILSNKSAPFI